MNANRRVSVRVAALNRDLRDMPPILQKAGFAGVQLDMKIGGVSLEQLSDSGRRELLHLFQRYGLQLESLGVSLSKVDLTNESNHDRLLWSMSKTLQTAFNLGIQTTCVEIGSLPDFRPADEPSAKPIENPGLLIIPAFTQPKPSAPPIDPQSGLLWNRVDGLMREVGSLADRMGIRCALRSELSGFASLRRVLDGASCPWFGIDLDPVSVLRDPWSLERVLDEMGRDLLHVRVRDALCGRQGGTQVVGFGQGNVNWRELITLLDECDYQGWFGIDTADLLDREVEAFKALSGLSLIK